MGKGVQGYLPCIPAGLCAGCYRQMVLLRFWKQFNSQPRGTPSLPWPQVQGALVPALDLSPWAEGGEDKYTEQLQPKERSMGSVQFHPAPGNEDSKLDFFK